MARSNQHYMTETERHKLEAYLRAGKPVSWIAREMDCTRQTIYNEISRGRIFENGKAVYSAAAGQAEQDRRSGNKGCPQKLDQASPLLAYLEKKMLGVQEDGTIDPRKRYSPAAALAAAKADGLEVNIGVTTLYHYIDQNKFPTLRNSDLWEKTKRKPRKKEIRPRKVHKNLPSIEERPKPINERAESGHWEMDLIVSCTGSTACLLTLTERTTREEIIVKLPNKKARTVRRAFNRLERSITNFRERIKTITTDNGSEFLEYDKLKKSVLDKGDRFQVYYCHSYSAWEKGSNENHNRMIRRWFPKGTDFSKVSKEDVEACQEWMNQYPRKILGWNNPVQEAAKWGPARLKPLRGAPLKSIPFPISQPAAGRFFHTVHIDLLRILLKFQYFLLRHHIALFHFMFQVAHTSQCVICVIIFITHKPAGPGKGRYHLRRSGVLHIPGIIKIKALESPQLITVYHIACYLPEQSVNVGKTLGSIKQAYVIMAAGQYRIQEQRIDICLKIPAVHLYRKFVSKNECYRQRIMFIIISLLSFRRDNNLFQRYKLFIGNIQRHIADNLDTLCNNFPSSGTPDRFAVVLFISGDNPVNNGKSFTATKEAGISHKFPCAAEIIILMQDIMINVTYSIPCQADRMGHSTPKCGEEQQTRAQDKENQYNHGPPSITPEVHKRGTNPANGGKDAAHQRDRRHEMKHIRQ